MTTDLGALGEFEDGQVRLFRIGRRELGVLRWGDRLVAIRNTCPHAGAPLCSGVVAPLIEGGVREAATATVASHPTRLAISCPWHGWEFDVDTGQALADPKMRVKTYALAVVDGRVVIDL